MASVGLMAVIHWNSVVQRHRSDRRDSGEAKDPARAIPGGAATMACGCSCSTFWRSPSCHVRPLDETGAAVVTESPFGVSSAFRHPECRRNHEIRGC